MKEFVMRGPLLRLCIVTLSLVGFIVVLGMMGAASQRSFEELGARIAAKYLDLPSLIQDSKFYYYGFGQGKSVYVRLEIPNEYVAQFLSKMCPSNMTTLSKYSNPFKVQPSGGAGVPVWWTPLEDPSATGGSCSRDGVGIGVSIVSGRERAAVYIYLGIA
jgi:hypothetical protein